MIAFRSSALALAVLMTVVRPAPAQLWGPASEAPPAGAGAATRDPAAPVRLGPRRSVVPGPAAPVAPAGLPATPPAIKLQTLDTVDVDSVGTLDDAQGGLGVDMWRGTARPLVVRLLALMPRRVSSPTERDLMRRLLLTRAVAPESENREPPLFVRRLAALAGLGDRASTRALLELAPPGIVDEQLLWMRAENAFFGHDIANACRVVQGEAREQKSAYWLQATAFCLALDGKTAEASLVSDILDERGASVPSVFFAAMEAISGATPPPFDGAAKLTGMHLAMMRAARLAMPAGTLQDASPAALAAIASQPDTPVDQRLAAAEQAALLGTLNGAALFQIYGDAGIAVGDSDAALDRASEQWGPRGRALLLRAAARYDVPAARAEVLQRAFKLAAEKGGFHEVALAAGPLLQGMQPVDELRWFAPQAARALLIAGHLEAAKGWIALGLQGGGADGAALWPFSALMEDRDGAVTPEAVAAWWRAQDRAAPGTAARARVLFTLLEAGGLALPGALWTDILAEPRQGGLEGPSLVLRHALANAAAGGRRGETVALAVLTLGEAGAVPANLPAVEAVMPALRQVGLAADARRIALETALAAGL